MTVKKRFIAGAVCPRCGEMDKLLSYTNDEGVYKECVACDFVEKQAVQVELNELDTRVNNMPGTEEEEAVQIVQMIDLPKK